MRRMRVAWKSDKSQHSRTKSRDGRVATVTTALSIVLSFTSSIAYDRRVRRGCYSPPLAEVCAVYRFSKFYSLCRRQLSKYFDFFFWFSVRTFRGLPLPSLKFTPRPLQPGQMGFCGHSAIFSSRVERRFGPVVARKTYTRVCNDIARSSVCPLVRIVEVGRPLSVCRYRRLLFSWITSSAACVLACVSAFLVAGSFVVRTSIVS